MNKKYNEVMVIQNGKMVYAISLKDKGTKQSDRTHIVMDCGKVWFSDNWFGSEIEFNFSEEAHKIAKEIFVSQLQVDIKRRVLELKQLEEIFNDLNLSECLGTALTDSAKKILELENKIEQKTTEIVNNAIEKQIRPIARRKKKIQETKDE